tara:strand:+ start:68 stop:304 length:237 start_codon:yes stop_codon:yes gene_type:complete
MAKYKNLDENIINEFIGKIFGALAKNKAKSVVKDLSKKDPKLGKRLAYAKKLADDTQKYLNSLPKAERDAIYDEWEAL